LVIYDQEVRKRLELDFNPELGYESRSGDEYPISPLRVLRIWAETESPEQLIERDVSGESLFLYPQGG
jgi:hypothetical protein